MLWEAFSFNGAYCFFFFKGIQCTEDYEKTLEFQLLPFGKFLGWDKWKYQQVNCYISVSKSTTQWF